MDGHPPGRTRFVGRRHELTLLEERLAAAGRGQGGVVLVGGEPGIGKTRLVGELADLAAGDGWWVLVGRADESEGLPPYLPIAEALRGLAATALAEDAAADLARDAPEVAALVPELRHLLPSAPAGAAVSPEHGRYRLFQSTVDALLKAARTSPRGLLLVLDDLHWADAPSLLLLRHLARRLAAAPILVVGTYRPAEVGPRHPLAGVLADLHRERLAERVVLTGLSPSETAELLHTLHGRPVAAEPAARLHRETDGNPLFVEEMVRQLRGEGRRLDDPGAAPGQWAVPEGVREVVERRVARLSPDARRLLEAGAVLGDGASAELLRAVGDLAEGAFLDALDEALAAALLREREQGYDFGHPLFRRALYDRLSRPRRQRLHLAAAEAIERGRDREAAPRLAALAAHYRLAGPAAAPGRVLDSARRAAAAAQRVFAWEQAASHWQTALEELGADDPPTRCDLLLSLGEALVRAGEPLRVADEVAPAALALAEAAGDSQRAYRACALGLLGLRHYGSSALVGTPAYRAWAERVDRFAAPGTRERVDADLVVAHVHDEAGQAGRGWALRRGALALARDLGDVQALVGVAAEIINWPWDPEYWPERLRAAEEFSARSWPGITPDAAVHLLRAAGRVYLDWGRRDRAEELWRQAADVEAPTRSSLPPLRPIMDAILALLDGRLDEVLALGGRLVALADEVGMRVHGRQWSSILRTRALLHLGRAEEALAAASEARRLAGLPEQAVRGVGGFFAGRYALCLAHLRRDREAADLLERLLSQGVGPDSGTSANTLTYFLETAVLVRNRDAAARLSARLASLAGCATTDMALTSVGRHLGAAAELTGDPDGARACYEQALAAAERVSFRPEIALARLQLGTLLSRRGDRAAARRHLQLALAELRAMRMRPAIERALRALEPIGGAPPAGPVRPDRLTDREAEVLRLLADGRTNREMAEELVLSPRTVERHLANIYGKIGARGRADAAAYAVRRGLVDAGSA